MTLPTPEDIAELWNVHTGVEATAERARRADAFDDTRTWVDERGYRLSDRLWQQRAWVRSQIDEVLRQAIRTGEDALVTATKLEQFLSPDFAPVRTERGRLKRNQARAIITSSPGRGGSGSFPARRLARTEITRAHGQATIWTAERTPFAKGVKWNLSGRHPKADTCNGHATKNSGLGPGVYATTDVPRYPDHPQDLCHLAVVTEDDVDAIVKSLREQYGLDESPLTEPATTSLSNVSGITDPKILASIADAQAYAERAGIKVVKIEYDSQTRHAGARSIADRILISGPKTHKGLAKSIAKDKDWTVSARTSDPVASMIRHEYGHQAASPSNQGSRAHEAYRAVVNSYLTPSQREARQRIGVEDLGWTKDDMPDYVQTYHNDNTIISEGWAEVFASQGKPEVWSWPKAIRDIIEEHPDVFSV